MAVPEGSQLAVPNGSQLAVPMPEHLTIGTRWKSSWQYQVEASWQYQMEVNWHHPFPYKQRQIGSEQIYVCTKGSQWARTGEVLVLRRGTDVDYPGTWTAFDSDFSADGSTLQCRQAVFRCLATDITQPGWHQWETNYNANPNGAGLAVDWQGALWAETRLP